MRCLVGLDADDAIVGERARRVGQQPDRLQHVGGEHRLVDVELEMALARADRDRGVIAEHPAAHHRQRLALGRIDLAGHDRGAGLVLRQDQFAEARARAGAEQADVVGDLEQVGGERVQRAMRERIGAVRGQRLELVRRADERQPGDRRDLLRKQLGEARMRVEPGADRGAALRQRIELLERQPVAGDAAVRPARRSRRTPGRASAAWRPACGCGRS